MRISELLSGARMSFVVLLGGLLTGCASDGPSTTEPSGKALAAFESYRNDHIFFDYKAFAWDRLSGDWASAWGARHPRDAIRIAKERCRKKRGDCEIYAIGKSVVLDENPEKQAAAIVKYMERLTNVPENSADRGANLSAAEIRRALTGKEMSGRTFNGLTFVAQLYDTGSIRLQLHSPQAKVRKSDRGKWWVEEGASGGNFCRWFNYYYGSRTECQTVVKQGQWYVFYNPLGDYVLKAIPYGSVK